MRRMVLYLALLGFLCSGADACIEKELIDLKAKVKAVEGILDTLQREVGSKVAFSATLTKGNDVFKGPSGSRDLVFKRVITNVGNAYNSGTGVFTAPVMGVYFFNINSINRNKHNTGMILMKNGRLQVSTWEDKGRDTSHTMSNSVVLALNPRDTVHVMRFPDTQVYDNANRHTTFSGFLLFPQAD